MRYTTKNGQLMADFSNEKGLKLFYDDGQLVMASNPQTGETITYHENGNPYSYRWNYINFI